MSASAAVLLALAFWAAPGRTASDRLHHLRRRGAPTAAAATQRPRWLTPVVGLGAGAGVAALIGGTGGVVLGAGLGVLAAVGVRRAMRRDLNPPTRLQLGGAWDLFAACLRAGLPTVTGLRAAAARLPQSPARQLERVADLLTLGADPRTAWAAAETLPGAAGLVRAAGRSATSGAGLADIAAAAAADVRAQAADAAEATAQRAAVAVAGPLGLCFLPAFLVLGVVPVVIGLAESLLARW